MVYSIIRHSAVACIISEIASPDRVIVVATINRPTANATTLFSTVFSLFIISFLFLFRRRILRDAWTDFQETLPDDIICIDKFYALLFLFQRPIMERRQTTRRFGHFRHTTSS